MGKMKLSIITINYNNAEGLRKTLASVASQTYCDIEHIVIDGASTDGSVEVINDYVNQCMMYNVLWVSEKDNGIYNAMNKGIEIALGKRVVNALNRSTLCGDKNKGINRSERREDKNSEADRPEGTGVENKALPDYIQILNSGDILAAPDVTERMMDALDKHHTSHITHHTSVEILYGNMIKQWPDGRCEVDKGKHGN